MQNQPYILRLFLARLGKVLNKCKPSTTVIIIPAYAPKQPERCVPLPDILNEVLRCSWGQSLCWHLPKNPQRMHARLCATSDDVPGFAQAAKHILALLLY